MALVIALAVNFRPVHILLAHVHENHECSAARSPIGTHHIHDASYIVDDCVFCDFIIGASELPVWAQWEILPRAVFGETTQCFSHSFQFDRFLTRFYLRGPPSLIRVAGAF